MNQENGKGGEKLLTLEDPPPGWGVVHDPEVLGDILGNAYILLKNNEFRGGTIFEMLKKC